MAAPLTHIILTNKIYDKYFSNSNKKDFILWTMIPDIRYINKLIPRTLFHTEDIDLTKVITKTNDFKKWVLFHSLLDVSRDQFYIQKWTYNPWVNELFIISLKLLEDEYLYDKIKNRNLYQDILTEHNKLKLDNINSTDIQNWNTLLCNYCRQKPDNESRHIFLRALSFEDTKIDQINTTIQNISNEKTFKLIDALYENIEKLIINF